MRKLVLTVVAALFAAATLSVYAADQKKTAPAAAPADKNLKYESSVGESQAGTPANANPHTEDAKYQSSVGEKQGGAPVSSTAKATEPVKVQTDPARNPTPPAKKK